MDNFSIPQEKANQLMFDLLFHVRIELQAMRDTMAIEYAERTGSNDFAKVYEERLKDVRQTITAQIKAHYSGFDVDDFLKNVAS
jgi:hypothetical protein